MIDEAAIRLRFEAAGPVLHRLFSFITQNWRGRPLISHQVIVELIAATKTKAGLTVRANP